MSAHQFFGAIFWILELFFDIMKVKELIREEETIEKKLPLDAINLAITYFSIG